MEQYENEVELIEYLNVLWKRRWLIIVPTILLALVAGVVSFLIPPAWDVDAIIQPSKFFVRSEQGTFTEVVVMDPKQLAGQINQGSYNRLISAELNLDPRKFPNVKAENLRDTKLVRVSIRTGETDKAQTILNALFQHLKSELDRKIEVEIKDADSQIKARENQISLMKLRIKDAENDIKTKENDIKKENNDIKLKDLNIQTNEIEKDKIKKEIETDNSKLKISEERAASIGDEMKSVKTRIDEIDKQLQKVLAEKRQGGDAIALLLYSNDVQQNLRYYGTLDEKMTAEKLAQENLRQDIRDKESELRQKDNLNSQIQTQKDSIKAGIDTILTQISNVKTGIDKINNEISLAKNEIQFINEKKQRIDYAQLVKEPTVSLYPVSPRKKMNVLIAGFLGFFCFSILALFLDYVKKGNIRLKTGT